MSEFNTNTTAETNDTAVGNHQELTVANILRQIEKIMEDNGHIYEALKMLEGVKSEGPGDIGAEEKAKGIAEVVKCRETTNQQMLAFYERLYDEIKPKRDVSAERRQFLDFVQKTTACAGPGGELPNFEKIWRVVFSGE